MHISPQVGKTASPEDKKDVIKMKKPERTIFRTLLTFADFRTTEAYK